jgi:peptidyl-tRNA hydrolase, PTH1 family
MAEICVIAGLGNPGKEYVETRHNAGFKVVDAFAEKLGVDVKKKKFSSLVGEAEFKGKKLILLKPQQFMNRSGQSVATVMGFYKLKLSSLIVVSDDMAIEPGTIRVRAKGSAGGHNGLADIIEKLGSNEFARVRVGIGASPFADSRNYVLGKMDSGEAELMDEACANAVEALFGLLEGEIDLVMNRFNVKNSEARDQKSE